MDSGLGGVHLAMQLMLLVWVGLVVAVVRRTIARGSVGLPAALVLTMSFLYGGCFVYAVPGYTHLRPDGHWYLISYGFSEEMVVKATFASLLGLLGFAIGCGALRRSTTRSANLYIQASTAPGHEKTLLLVLGSLAVASFLLNFLRVSFPLSDALLEVGRNLAVVVVCLGAFLAKRKAERKVISNWIFVAALVPAYYLFLFGFVSYGFLFGTIILAFWMAQLKHRFRAKLSLRKALIVFAVIYLLLSAFIGWFSFRDEIRLAIWEGSGSASDVLLRALSGTELFSPWNFSSLDLVNIRLNLNIFIGKMIAQHELHPDLVQYGRTLVILPLVLLPRFLWPDKPTRGGSDFMSEHTGMMLSDSATFGTGTVFEFFINFGYLGVLLGFMLLGWIISRLDRAAAKHLQRGDFMSFARTYAVGIVAIDPLLRPFFIVNGAVFAWIIMTALKIALNRRKRTPLAANSRVPRLRLDVKKQL